MFLKVFVMLLMILSVAGYLFAEESVEDGAVFVGNKICPVSGERLNEGSIVTYEYKGKIYSFCCPMCVEEFKKDPERYIEELEKSKGDNGHSGHKHHHDH